MFKKTGDLKDIMKSYATDYGVKIVATTQRTVISPRKHNFTSIVYDARSDKFYTEAPYNDIDVIDRIGSGDAYVAGVLFGLLKYGDPEKAMQFGNATSSVKNTVPGDDLIEGFQTDFDKTKLDTGVRKWTWFVKNGNGTDGTPYDVSQYKVKETRQVAMNHFGENDRWDTAEFAGLTPAGSTPDGLKWQKIQDIYDLSKIFYFIVFSEGHILDFRF